MQVTECWVIKALENIPICLHHNTTTKVPCTSVHFQREADTIIMGITKITEAAIIKITEGAVTKEATTKRATMHHSRDISPTPLVDLHSKDMGTLVEEAMTKEVDTEADLTSEEEVNRTIIKAATRDRRRPITSENYELFCVAFTVFWIINYFYSRGL